MRNLRWLAALAVLLVGSCAAWADGSTPPDGSAGVVGGHHSTMIDTLTYNFTFTPCTSPTDDNGDCGAFGDTNIPQEVFGGQNTSGVAWTSLQITLDFSTPTTAADSFVTCYGGTLFTILGGGCNEDLPVGSTSVTLDFSQGTGSGIGCDDGTGASYDITCLTNSIAAEQYNFLNPTSPPEPYDYSGDSSCPPAQAPGEVCGPSNFVIGVGFGAGDTWTDLPPGGTLVANPEPSALLLVAGPLLGMFLLSLKRGARLA